MLLSSSSNYSCGNFRNIQKVPAVGGARDGCLLVFPVLNNPCPTEDAWELCFSEISPNWREGEAGVGRAGGGIPNSERG